MICVLLENISSHATHSETVSVSYALRGPFKSVKIQGTPWANDGVLSSIRNYTFTEVRC